MVLWEYLINQRTKFRWQLFKMGEDVKPNRVLQMIEEHNQSLDLEPFPALKDTLQEGKTRRIVDSELPLTVRLIFNSQFNGKAALVAPVRVAGHAFGLLGFVWSEELENGFKDHEVALVEGISDQIGNGARTRPALSGSDAFKV